MKIESVETKDELLTKLGVESNRTSSFSSKTETDIKQINELIQKIKTDLSGKLNTLYSDYEAAKIA